MFAFFIRSLFSVGIIIFMTFLLNFMKCWKLWSTNEQILRNNDCILFQLEDMKMEKLPESLPLARVYLTDEEKQQVRRFTQKFEAVRI